jgi:hypothetical protein
VRNARSYQNTDRVKQRVHFGEKNWSEKGTCECQGSKMQDYNMAGHVARTVTQWKQENLNRQIQGK